MKLARNFYPLMLTYLVYYISRESLNDAKGIVATAVCVSVCVCLSVWLFLAACPHYCTGPDVTWGNGRGCLLVVQYWADLQLVHEFCWYDSIAPNAKCQRVLACTRSVPGLESSDR